MIWLPPLSARSARPPEAGDGGEDSARDRVTAAAGGALGLVKSVAEVVNGEVGGGAAAAVALGALSCRGAVTTVYEPVASASATRATSARYPPKPPCSTARASLTSSLSTQLEVPVSIAISPTPELPTPFTASSPSAKSIMNVLLMNGSFPSITQPQSRSTVSASAADGSVVDLPVYGSTPAGPKLSEIDSS